MSRSVGRVFEELIGHADSAQPKPSDVNILDYHTGTPDSIGTLLVERFLANGDTVLATDTNSEALRRSRSNPGRSPAADAQGGFGGVFGELRIALLASSMVSSGGVTIAEAQGAFRGWQGDRFGTWSAGGHDCVRLTIQSSNSAALASVLNKFVAEHPGAPLVGTSPAQLTTCFLTT